jgi:MscS family membrane protein
VHNQETLKKEIFALERINNYINSFSFAKTVNEILSPYNLSIVKILLIFILVSLFYFLRKIVYFAIEKALIQIQFLQNYVANIVSKIYKLIELFILLIGIEMIIYIYNDFSGIENINKLFNMAYYMIITFIVYQVLNVVVGMKIHNIDLDNKHIKNEMINISLKIVNFMIFLVGLLIILSYAGVDLTAILSGLGIGGLAVALAARESLSNFFGTVSILLSDVFSQGDWIVIGKEEGVVIEIGLRVTTLRTFDNALIAIPNGLLANQDVKNWNKRIIGRRIKMNLGVKYNSKSSDIKNAVNEIREMLLNHPQIATQNTFCDYDSGKSTKLVSHDDEQGVKKTLLVYLDEFSSSSITILVYCFTKSTDWELWLQTKEDVMYKIMGIFEKNSLEFAFASMSIYNENETKENK